MAARPATPISESRASTRCREEAACFLKSSLSLGSGCEHWSLADFTKFTNAGKGTPKASLIRYNTSKWCNNQMPFFLWKRGCTQSPWSTANPPLMTLSTKASGSNLHNSGKFLLVDCACFSKHSATTASSWTVSTLVRLSVERSTQQEVMQPIV